MSGVAVVKHLFAARNIGTDQLPAVSVGPLAINEAVEAQRARFVQEQFGSTFPGVVQ
jgi:4-carboxymuconolactone decarboxylase